MKKILLILLIVPFILNAQVSVYDCSAINPVVTQANIENAGAEYHKPCILFEAAQQYEFTQDVNKKVTAIERINMEQDFYAGPYNQGSMWLKLEEKSLFDVAVMNYLDLDNIQKFKKLEFGIDLEGELENRIKEYLEPGSYTGVDPINPFLDWDLDIDAVFFHPQSGTVKNRDFFYYHNYSVVSNDWDDGINTNNNQIMRVRFAPPLTGTWECRISIKVDGTTSYLPSFIFNVVETNHLGYVKVHHNKKNLQLGPDIVFPLGHALPCPFNRVDGSGRTTWGGPMNEWNPVPNPDKSNRNVSPEDWAQYIGDIQDYINQGGKTIKTVQASYSNLIEFENLGNYYGRMHYAWEQDKILDICEQNNVLINFNLLFQDVIMAYGQNQNGQYPEPWDYGPYGQDGADYNTIPWTSLEYNTYCYYVPGTLPSNMFLDNTLYNEQTQPAVDGHKLIDYHKQRTRYYVARYGYSPQIYTWELISEPLHMDEYNGADKPAQTPTHPGYATAINAIDTYHNEMSNYIKNDLDDSDHLITIQIAPQENIHYTTLQSASNTNIDILGFNHYSFRPDKLVVAKPKHSNHSKDDKKAKYNLDWGDTSETSIYRSTQLFKISQPGLDKPVILSEVGHGWESECEGKTGNIIDVMTFGFSGIAAMHPWGGYSYGINNEPDGRQLWQATIYAEQHMNSDKVIPTLNNWSGLWKQGRQVQKVYNISSNYRLKELQYYLSQNNEFATGYVRNRSYNVWTARISNSCSTLVNEQGFQSPLDNYYLFNYDTGNRKLYIKGVQKKTWYRIYWYSFITGTHYGTQIKKSDNKYRLKLEYPSLTLENPTRPIWWFKIEKVYNAKFSDEVSTENSNESKREELQVHPNPFSNDLIIKAPFKGHLTLYTSLGVIIKTFSFEKGENVLYLNNLTKGIYFIHFSDGSIKKIVKI